MSYTCWWSWSIRSELFCLFWRWCRCCLDDQGAWCQGGGHDAMLSSKQWPSWDETKWSDCFRDPSDDYPIALAPNDHHFGPIKVGEKFDAWPAGSGDPLRFDPIGPGGGVPDPDHMPVPGSIDIHGILFVELFKPICDPKKPLNLDLFETLKPNPPDSSERLSRPKTKAWTGRRPGRRSKWPVEKWGVSALNCLRHARSADLSWRARAARKRRCGWGSVKPQGWLSLSLKYGMFLFGYKHII